jgi:hypothetical protein
MYLYPIINELFPRIGLSFVNLSSHVASIAQDFDNKGKAVLNCTNLNVIAGMYYLLFKQNDATK